MGRLTGKRLHDAIVRTRFDLIPGGTPGGGELYFLKMYHKGNPTQYLEITVGSSFDFENDLKPLLRHMLQWWVKLWDQRN